MSTYWHLHCLPCQERTEDVRNGDVAPIIAYLNAWPRIVDLIKRLPDLEVRHPGVDAPDLQSFMSKHGRKGHLLMIESEYGDVCNPMNGAIRKRGK